ncbi:uncharacterized protein LOC132804256 [Ziziphus jujuba]|uniref:Uncharacterized protein LOC132804256 n=1 Tax=Ziziphus jujuba TaxID=326968 RepID=A0ABM4AC44_ZIZJJ|nr:uncharacterized protein LOC132804256 [Ziziphus jujuba]
MGERKLLSPEIVQVTVDKVNIIQAKLKAVQDRQKSYGDVRRKDLKFEELSRVHDVFHISMLRKYISDPSHVLETPEIELRDDLSYEEQPVQILGREEKRLRNKIIALVKVLRRNQIVEEATWEREDQMRSQYPYLFQN